ncbi:formate dehydrogenase accessory sulfurtransferase FdhD [Limnochorda pilosa]|uniref:Sulfur carrier protein FdhD n=1 Tax=Limnochorda pilosa TaxID=1555112 RepID=A0A0K2SHG1_LIMPI|nr:formate dehydrogenase accessory sulfurtransferase FdhD [Limnochorda pilosa]BAS26530.1 formate dehydrogenase [Limnochorda pilosa]
MHAARGSTTRRRVLEVRPEAPRWRGDVLAVEEPMEIRLCPFGAQKPVRVAVTMRTPGHDFELAAGFLFTEGILASRDQVRFMSYCTDPELEGEQQYNVVNVFLRPGVALDPERFHRNFYTTSSCGVCGKAALETVHTRGIAPIPMGPLQLEADVVGRLGECLREAQRLFDQTGGLHAAGLFAADGTGQAVREDVGRHNATDKVIGHAFLEGRVPLSGSILVVSGRASFEIVQKAAVAGIPVVVAVSAPSSLACETAQAFGMTLVGFARGDRFNVYTGHERLRASRAEVTAGR